LQNTPTSNSAGTPRQLGAVIGDICNRSESDRAVAPLTRKFRGHRPNPRLHSSTGLARRGKVSLQGRPTRCGAGNDHGTPRPHEYPRSQDDHRALHTDQRRKAQRALHADAEGVLHDFCAENDRKRIRPETVELHRIIMGNINGFPSGAVSSMKRTRCIEQSPGIPCNKQRRSERSAISGAGRRIPRAAGTFCSCGHPRIAESAHQDISQPINAAINHLMLKVVLRSVPFRLNHPGWALQIAAYGQSSSTKRQEVLSPERTRKGQQGCR
jgi:hypothetical protein